VVLDIYLGGILIAATALFWSTSRAASRGVLRVGLATMAIGLLFNALYALQRIAFVLAQALGMSAPAAATDPIFGGLRALGVILVLAGALVPATGWLRSVSRARTSLRALRPLWSLMQRAFPEIILFSPRRALVERFGVDHVHLRLYRRVIEIRDGLLALRLYLPADFAPQVSSYLGPAASDALAEACGIELALSQHSAGQPAPDGGGRWALVGAELGDEVDWLRQVSGCPGRPEPGAFVDWWTRNHRDDPQLSPAPS
jgi:hypothetical protein